MSRDQLGGARLGLYLLGGEGGPSLLKDGDGGHHKKCENNNRDLFRINDVQVFPSSIFSKRV